jgi:multidrug efflux system membrane fusion protein
MFKRRRALTLTTALVAAIGASACHRQAPKTARAVPVVTDRVATGEVPITRTGLGQVQAFTTAVARAQVGGQIVKIEFVEGQAVRQGDPIAQIDPRPFEAAVAQDEANIGRDQASLANAQVELDRYLRVGSTGLLSEQPLQTLRSQVAQLKATVAADQAAARRDRLQLDFASVRSPIAGVTGLRLIDVGNLVGPTDPQGLVTISQIQPIAFLFSLPQGDLAAIRSAMVSAGDAGLQVEIFPQGDESRRLDVGRLVLINNQVNLGSGTITLKATSPNAKKLLWPGEFVETRLILARRANGLTVPTSVVQRGANGTYAWVVNADRTVAQRPIRAGETLGQRTVIESGLKAGEEVVTDGQFALTPGAHVTGVSRAPAKPVT